MHGAGLATHDGGGHTVGMLRILPFATALVLVGLGVPAQGQPMRCSGQYKACAADCAKAGGRTCVQICAQQLSYCVKTGCWQGSNYRVCSLLRQ